MSKKNSNALEKAAAKGDVAAVRALLREGINPKDNDSRCLSLAAGAGHLEIVQLLLPLTNPKENNSWALRKAADQGHEEVVKVLIPMSDPKANGSHALSLAAQAGHIQIVTLLIPHSDPKGWHSQALCAAAMNGHEKIIDLLWPVSDPDDALNNMQYHHPDAPELWMVLSQRCAAQRQQHVLREAVSMCSKPNRKKRRSKL